MDQFITLLRKMPFIAGFIYGRPVLLAELPKKPRRNRGTCNAKTRKGTLCQAPPVWDKIKDIPINGRCKLHGGLSTGPKTEKGREAIRASNKRRSKNKIQ